MKTINGQATLTRYNIGSHAQFVSEEANPVISHTESLNSNGPATLIQWDGPPQRVLTVDGVMELFDEAVEASIEHGDEDEAQDWLDIKDVRVDFLSRLTKSAKP